MPVQSPETQADADTPIEPRSIANTRCTSDQFPPVDMSGKKQTPVAPAWYQRDAYRSADDLDAGDWLLNLTLRCWLHGHPQEQTEEALRSVGPVLRRGDDAQMIRMHKADAHRWLYSFRSSEWPDVGEALREATERPSLPGDVWNALRTGEIPSGIDPLSVSALYAFERMLPDSIRSEGARMQRGETAVRSSPKFSGNLDDAFASQMVSRFVRIDLSLPDDVLRADLDRFLVRERNRLAAMGGEQPYRQAARLKLKSHELRTLAKVGLLQFLDLDRWQRLHGLGLSFYAVREMTGIADRSREAELRRRVALSLQQMQLHAWFARLERSGRRARSR